MEKFVTILFYNKFICFCNQTSGSKTMKKTDFSLTINHDGSYDPIVTHQTLPHEVMLIVIIRHHPLHPPKIAVTQNDFMPDDPQDVSWR
jgi:hypothetical protein